MAIKLDGTYFIVRSGGLARLSVYTSYLNRAVGTMWQVWQASRKKVNKGSSTITIDGKISHGAEIEKFKRTLTYPFNLKIESLSSKLIGQTLNLTGQKNPNQRANAQIQHESAAPTSRSPFADEFNKRAEDFFGRGMLDSFSSQPQQQAARGIEERSRSPYCSPSPQLQHGNKPDVVALDGGGLNFREKTEVNDGLRWEVHLIATENIRPDRIDTRLRGDREAFISELQINFDFWNITEKRVEWKTCGTELLSRVV